MVRIKKMRPLLLAFKLFFENSEILLKLGKNQRKSQIRYLEKGILEVCWAVTIKPRQKERYVFRSTSS